MSFYMLQYISIAVLCKTSVQEEGGHLVTHITAGHQDSQTYSSYWILKIIYLPFSLFFSYIFFMTFNSNIQWKICYNIWCHSRFFLPPPPPPPSPNSRYGLPSLYLLVDFDPVSQIWTPTKTLLMISGSRTRNKCELTHQFTFGKYGDIHCLSFCAMQKEVTSFLNLGQLRFPTKRSPWGKVVFCKLLFLCLQTVIPCVKI